MLSIRNFECISMFCTESCLQGRTKTRYMTDITVDGANGVGAIVMKEITEEIGNLLNVKIVSDGSSGALNHNVSI